MLMVSHGMKEACDAGTLPTYMACQAAPLLQLLLLWISAVQPDLACFVKAFNSQRRYMIQCCWPTLRHDMCSGHCWLTVITRNRNAVYVFSAND